MSDETLTPAESSAPETSVPEASVEDQTAPAASADQEVVHPVSDASAPAEAQPAAEAAAPEVAPGVAQLQREHQQARDAAANAQAAYESLKIAHDANVAKLNAANAKLAAIADLAKPE